MHRIPVRAGKQESKATKRTGRKSTRENYWDGEMDEQDGAGRQECKQRRISYLGRDESCSPVSRQASASWQLPPLTDSGLF